MTTSRVLWLASACPAAAVTPVKLRRGEAAFAQALVTGVAGSAAFGAYGRLAGHGTPAQNPARLPVHASRPMGDEQIRTADRGTQGPHDAWRRPVIP